MKLAGAVLVFVALAQANAFYFNGRITGGEEVAPHSIPWQVGLFLTANNGQQHFCGGSLISQNYVLTAAHCADGVKQAEVVLGAHKIRENEPTQVRMNSTELTVHERYQSTLIVNDIALIKLPQPVELNDNIKIIKIVPRKDQGNSFNGAIATVSGWGLDSDSATTISPVLRKVSAPVISNLRCSFSYPLLIRSSHLCVNGSGGKSSCNGDSGGPLTAQVDGETRQIGLVSFGRADGCERGHPHVYTRLTSFLDWIQQHSDVQID